MEICGYNVEYKKKRIKNIIIRITPTGRITLSVPVFVSDEEAADFFRSKLAWIERKMPKNEENISRSEFSDGESFYFFGEKITVKIIETGKTYISGGFLFLKKAKDNAAAAAKFLTKQLEKKAEKYFIETEKKSGLKPTLVSIRKTVSRWGSCNPKTGKINLSFYLVSLPEFCLEYVVIHELCHLKYANHGAGFKRLLTQLLPSWRETRKYLRENGEKTRLHF